MLFRQKTQLVCKCVDSRSAPILFPLEDTPSRKPDRFHPPQHSMADVLWQSLEDTSPENESHSCSSQLPKSPLLSPPPFFFFFLLCFIYIISPPNRLTEQRMLHGREGRYGKRLTKHLSVSETPALCSYSAEPVIAL